MKCRGEMLQTASVPSGDRLKREQEEGLSTASLFGLKNHLLRKSFHFSFKTRELFKICHCIKLFSRVRGPPELQTHIDSFK